MTYVAPLLQHMKDSNVIILNQSYSEDKQKLECRERKIAQPKSQRMFRAENLTLET